MFTRILLGLCVTVALTAGQAMAQDHRGTFAPGTKCLDGSAPKHLGRVQKSDGKMYDRWGCSDASPAAPMGVSAPRPAVATATPAPVTVGPEASAAYLAAQRAADAAATRPPASAPSTSSAPRAVAANNHAKSAMSLATMKALLEDEVAWGNNFRVSRVQFVKDVSRVLGSTVPLTISRFASVVLVPTGVEECTPQLTKTLLKVDTAGRTRPFGKCPEDGKLLFVGGIPFWSVEDGWLVISKDVVPR